MCRRHLEKLSVATVPRVWFVVEQEGVCFCCKLHSPTIILESVVERPVERVEFCDWQGAMRSNSLPIATIRNAARCKRQRALQVVATHPTDELSISIKHDIHQQVNISSKRSTAESRIITMLVMYSSGRTVIVILAWRMRVRRVILKATG